MSISFKSRVVLLLCGGNIDTTTFGRCLERGLASEGRLLRFERIFCFEITLKIPFFNHFCCRFNVTLDDCPGGIADLCKILAEIGVTIKDIMHERAWLKDIYSVEVSPVDFISYRILVIRLKFFNFQVKVVCETRDWEHAKELRSTLSKKYRDVVFNDTPLAISAEISTTQP